jgi:hypothetical protein
MLRLDSYMRREYGKKGVVTQVVGHIHIDVQEALSSITG